MTCTLNGAVVQCPVMEWEMLDVRRKLVKQTHSIGFIEEVVFVGQDFNMIGNTH